LNDFAGVPLASASALTKVAKPATATKSFAGSNPGFFMTSGRIEIVWSCEMKNIEPSGVARFNSCAAICPPAPGRFSTTTGAPTSSFSFSARARAIASVPPPAGKPTRMRTVLPVWANEEQAKNASSARAPARRTIRAKVARMRSSTAARQGRQAYQRRRAGL
jgi:hypothetical protein